MNFNDSYQEFHRKWKQKRCLHLHKQWYEKEPGKFVRISGETLYLICDDCGKVIAEMENKFS